MSDRTRVRSRICIGGPHEGTRLVERRDDAGHVLPISVRGGRYVPALLGDVPVFEWRSGNDGQGAADASGGGG